MSHNDESGALVWAPVEAHTRKENRPGQAPESPPEARCHLLGT